MSIPMTGVDLGDYACSFKFSHKGHAMPISIAIEEVFPLAEAPERVKFMSWRRRKPDKNGLKARGKLSIAGFYRWSTPPGRSGIVLETIVVGGVKCTSVEACQRFFDRLTEARGSRGSDRAFEPDSHPVSITRTEAGRRRADRIASSELEKRGL